MRVEAQDFGAVVLPANLDKKLRVQALRQGVKQHLPREWQHKIKEVALAARAGCSKVWHRDTVEGDLLGHWLRQYTGANDANLSDQQIIDLADDFAKQGQNRQSVGWCPGGLSAPVQADSGVRTVWLEWQGMCEWVASRGGEVVPRRGLYTLEAWSRRVACRYWWRRQIRRWVARQYERGAIELGIVGASAGAWYCSDRAVIRRDQQLQRNEAILRATIIESQSGQKMTMWDVAQTTVANPAIRRGELMTRIRGTEEWADRRDLSGIFVTLTCPSRFHAWLRHGGANPKFKGGTPSDAQKWLCANWARVRAALARMKITLMGYRVAEPHHDGCPHWHILAWCKPSAIESVAATLREYWLADDGDEPGAAEHRITIKPMIKGQGAGYVAKYISKNIDDAYTPAHLDDGAAKNSESESDLFDGRRVRMCDRVQAWASTWRIRQFQALGMPGVGVWRELRRIDGATAAAADDAVFSAWLAAHREGDRRANWGAYLDAQGGAMLARKDYRICIRFLDREKRGRYETVRERWAAGVMDQHPRVGMWVPQPVTPNHRVRWGAEGFSAVGSPPWTRLNNCTPGSTVSKAALANLADLAAMRAAGLLESDRPGAVMPAKPATPGPRADRINPLLNELSPSEAREAREAKKWADSEARRPGRSSYFFSG